MIVPLATLLMAGPAPAQESFVQTGTIEGPAAARSSQYGSFVLTVQPTGALYELRSAGVDLSLYTGRLVTVHGTLLHDPGGVQYGGLPLVEVVRVGEAKDDPASAGSCGNCGVDIGQEARTTLEDPEEVGGREVYERALEAAHSAGNDNAAIASEGDERESQGAGEVLVERGTGSSGAPVKAGSTAAKGATAGSATSPTIAEADEQAAGSHPAG